ncbi:MAG: hypothetical protein HUU50_15365 [Candidatus Brocadiae bacterium]|nr:hypothetical protein [Candidatus Brocadiia bacterium]
MLNHKKEFENNLLELCSSLYQEEEDIAQEIEEFQKNTVIVLPCGGESKRMAALAQDKHKTALTIPGGNTLLSRMIRSYAEEGAKEFVLLVGIHADSLIQSTDALLKDLKNITIKYSPDPEKPVGRGGAVLHAKEKGFIPPDSSIIVHNADDQIAGYPGNFFHDICKAHIITQKKGGCATAIVALLTSFAYTAMKIEKGKVVSMASKPQIPIPAHIGVSILGQEAQKRFQDLFDYSAKKDFEEHLFPLLIEEGKLCAFGIPGNTWYAINTPKEYETFLKAIVDPSH